MKKLIFLSPNTSERLELGGMIGVSVAPGEENKPLGLWGSISKEINFEISQRANWFDFCYNNHTPSLLSLGFKNNFLLLYTSRKIVG